MDEEISGKDKVQFVLKEMRVGCAKGVYRKGARYSSVQKFCADTGYRGTFVSDLKEQLDLDVDISEIIKPHWSLDVIFEEDSSRVRKKYVPPST